MTDANNPSRRAVLGAMAVVTAGAAIAVETLAQAPPDRSAWDAAMADYQAKAAAVEAGDLDEDGFDVLVDAMYEAREALIDMPAPSFAEVAAKLALLREYVRALGLITEADAAALQADVERLAAA